MEAQHIAEARSGAGAAATGNPAAAAGLPARGSTVAGVAATHALAVDSAARFPAEAFEAVKAQRLLGIQVPQALGGEGASIADVADVCFQLGQACSSTGMIYAMHQIKVACIMRHMGENATLQRMLRRLCSEQLLLASSTTEGQAAATSAPARRRSSTRRADASLSSAAPASSPTAPTPTASSPPRAARPMLRPPTRCWWRSSRATTRSSACRAGTRSACAAPAARASRCGAARSAEQILPDPYEKNSQRRPWCRSRTCCGARCGPGSPRGATARGAGLHPQRDARINGQMPPGRAAVHPGAVDAAHPARHAEHLAAHATSSA